MVLAFYGRAGLTVVFAWRKQYTAKMPMTVASENNTTERIWLIYQG
tara:strand:- start:1 stop:138 length:138 start_codon:yes stop_codon:yes gene_type:complete